MSDSDDGEDFLDGIFDMIPLTKRELAIARMMVSGFDEYLVECLNGEKPWRHRHHPNVFTAKTKLAWAHVRDAKDWDNVPGRIENAVRVREDQ